LPAIAQRRRFGQQDHQVLAAAAAQCGQQAQRCQALAEGGERRPHVGWAADDERRPVAVKPDVFHREGRGDQTGQLFGLRNEFFRSNGAHGRIPA